MGVELGKIVEIVTDEKKSQRAGSLVYSGSHTIYDLVLDCRERLLFFDASFVLRVITYSSSKTEEVCQGEYWGRHSSPRCWQADPDEQRKVQATFQKVR